MRLSSHGKNLKTHINKGSWTRQEDEKLLEYIKNHGEGSWSTLPKAAGLERCGKSCRVRWMNYLRPDIKRGDFCLDEEDLVIKLHALLGNRWSLIAGRLPGRTDNEVMNYWNSHIKRKLIRAGIDPNNHRIGQKIPLISCENTSAKSSVSSSNGGDEAASSSIQIAVRPRPLKILQKRALMSSL